MKERREEGMASFPMATGRNLTSAYALNYFDLIHSHNLASRRITQRTSGMTLEKVGIILHTPPLQMNCDFSTLYRIRSCTWADP